jgi:hypothetical protein
LLLLLGPLGLLLLLLVVVPAGCVQLQFPALDGSSWPGRCAGILAAYSDISQGGTVLASLPLGGWRLSTSQ